MAKGAKLRSIRRMIRLDLTRSDIIKQPQLMSTGKFNLIKDKETGKLKSEHPLVQGHKQKIINQNKIGYRKIKKQFSTSDGFQKAFGGTPVQIEKQYYEKLNKERLDEQKK